MRDPQKQMWCLGCNTRVVRQEDFDPSKHTLASNSLPSSSSPSSSSSVSVPSSSISSQAQPKETIKSAQPTAASTSTPSSLYSSTPPPASSSSNTPLFAPTTQGPSISDNTNNNNNSNNNTNTNNSSNNNNNINYNNGNNNNNDSANRANPLHFAINILHEKIYNLTVELSTVTRITNFYILYFDSMFSFFFFHLFYPINFPFFSLILIDTYDIGRYAKCLEECGLALRALGMKL